MIFSPLVSIGLLAVVIVISAINPSTSASFGQMILQATKGGKLAILPEFYAIHSATVKSTWARRSAAVLSICR